MTAEAKPFLQVVRGDPTAEEVAALVAVLTARAAAAAAARDGGGPARPSRWADRSRLVRGTAGRALRPSGPGAWRASALPG
ncbi:acyl-CoA carboxylase subunit epsilon [Actinomadura sp. WMMB 499]|uniref:acyl-CoA carboxylase subunit epsilon n=1 Tax=Actinomadura sp. WMMB 499 TaxID=1219491 RepID=UPI0012491973|nr:acyl-CoA carboxylase subunit epsilon [Actinomadura sp. WMMB 499]QFG21793.1 acyl-CoA carboxylase subunit epsilon [Actinomadura sp. WMMB 499]